MIYDITIPINETLAVWPGDVAFSYTSTAWGAITVGCITLSCHTGTHVDAPRHFLPTGSGIDEIPSEVYIGECLVVEASGQPSLGPEIFAQAALPPRVLVKTLAWTDHTVFPESVPTLTREAVAVLAQAGVCLFGIDVPSVDALDSKDLPLHHALAAASIHILESVDLRAVPAGRYELIALPLHLAHADGSPVRALLRAANKLAPALETLTSPRSGQQLF